MPSPHTAATPSTSNATPTSKLSTAAYSGKLYASPPSRTTLPGIDLDAAASRNYSHLSPHSSSNTAATNLVYPHPHISSAVSTTHPSQAIFSAAALPRTSSLLPPPRIAVSPSGPSPPAFQNPFNVAPTRGPHSDSVNNLEYPRNRHSRSSSTGGLGDSFRNLNRWSASTTSSRASVKTSFTRRMSVDFIGSTVHTPKRLQKQRPSVASQQSPRSPARSRKGSSPSPAPIPPLQSLPRIAALPSLELEVNESNLLVGTASTRLLEPDAYSQERDYIDWDDSVRTARQTPAESSQIGSAGPLMAPAVIMRDSAMPRTQNGETRGHTRSRSTQNGSQDTTATARSRSSRGASQKAMLSKALQKANAAVELDNAANFEGARSAYSEACELLQQVLQRTSGEEDRKKLEAIRVTYTSRIDELNQLLPPPQLDTKALPRRPDVPDRQEMTSPASDYEDAIIGTARAARIGRDGTPDREPQVIPSYSRPRAAATPTPTLAFETGRDGPSGSLTEQYSLQSSFSRPTKKPDNLVLPRPMDQQYMPPPLSPRRAISPTYPAQPSSPDRALRSDFLAPTMKPQNAVPRGHQRGNSHESTSWLESIEESGGSTVSSVHSRSSSLGIRRKHIRAASGDTEAEFDAALDDAIEAAYNDGYDPESDVDPGEVGPRGESHEDPEAAVARTLRRVEMARERVRESEREALELVNERERQLRLQLQMEDEEQGYNALTPQDFLFDVNDSDDEERILEEMTQGYVIEDFTFGAKSRPSVPRESDSSGLTSRTWHSSMGSNPPTATTVLTTVSESTIVSNHTKPPGVLPPPPSQALPQLPQLPSQPLSAGSQNSKESVRNRRLSGQNPKQLKIETAKMSPTKAPATAGPVLAQPRTGGYIAQQRQALSAGPNRTNGPAPPKPSVSPVPGGNMREDIGTPPLPTALTQDGEPRSGSPSVPRPVLRKNFSSSSLRSMKSRNLSVSNIDDASDMSPGTPMSNHFGAGASTSRLPAMPSLPTPIVTAFKDRINNSSTGGLYLFESDFHSPRSPRSANSLTGDTPAPLEPCPSDTLLRPFWLMRCLYQTLCHPRGGYISNKLFIPRDVWRTKGVKLKNIEDKIASCDLLTAALQKLAKADSNDADAVLDEMQTLENILEQVQVTLTRKLGNEVGVQSTGNMFREANADEAAASMPRSASVSAKSSSFSWRRLRSKNSSAALANNYSGKSGGAGIPIPATPIEGSGKDMLLPSLPMTAHPTSRPAKRDVERVQFGGPNASYMSSLAKLFDAAQAVDQIARQVDDPGLRHADKTQVGLELCTRHAAEFFAFYICRFVLTDLTLLLDKFVKRGSEWVLA